MMNRQDWDDDTDDVIGLAGLVLLIALVIAFLTSI